MDNWEVCAGQLAKIVDLRMAIVTCSNTVIGLGCQNLLELLLAVRPPCIRVAGLQETAAAAAAEVVGLVGPHFDKIFFPHKGRDHKAQIICNWITVTLSYYLTRILNRKLELQILVPVRIDSQFSFPDPFGIILIDIFDFKVMFNVEFFQSGPD